MTSLNENKLGYTIIDIIYKYLQFSEEVINLPNIVNVFIEIRYTVQFDIPCIFPSPQDTR